MSKTKIVDLIEYKKHRKIKYRVKQKIKEFKEFVNLYFTKYYRN